MIIAPTSPHAARRARPRWLWSGADLHAQAATGIDALVAGGAVPSASGALGAAHLLLSGTTNLVQNPSMEANTSGWSTAGGGTVSIARTTAAAHSGSAALRVTCPNDVSNQGCVYGYPGIMPVTAGQPYVASAHLALISGAATVQLRIGWLAADTTTVLSWTETAEFSIAAGWTRRTVVGTAPASAAYACLVINRASGYTGSGVWDVDGVQFEQRSVATDYCDGSLGTGYAWSGTAHASSSTRTASRLQSMVHVDAAHGALAAWLRPQWAANDGAEHVVLHASPAAGEVRLSATAAGAWRFTLGGASVEVAQAHAAGADVLLVARWSTNALHLGAGGAEATAVRGTVTALPPAPADLGRRTDTAAGYAEAAIGPVLLLGGPVGVATAEALRRLARAPRWSDAW